jgi:hypothetical protein
MALDIDSSWLNNPSTETGRLYAFFKTEDKASFDRLKLMTLAMLLQKRYNRSSRVFDLFH